MKGICEICGAEENLTHHHLVPQVKAKKRFAKESKTISICSLCHTTLHAKFKESFLRDHLSSLDQILKEERMKDYLNWRKKHLNFHSNSTKKSW